MNINGSDVDVTQLTEEQKLIVEVFSHLVGRRLTHIEATFSDKTQRESFKKMAENDVYEARNELLRGMLKLENKA